MCLKKKREINSLNLAATLRLAPTSRRTNPVAQDVSSTGRPRFRGGPRPVACRRTCGVFMLMLAVLFMGMFPLRTADCGLRCALSGPHQLGCSHRGCRHGHICWSEVNRVQQESHDRIARFAFRSRRGGLADSNCEEKPPELSQALTNNLQSHLVIIRIPANTRVFLGMCGILRKNR